MFNDKYHSGNLFEMVSSEQTEGNHLLELSVRTQLDLRDVGHGGRNPLQHAPELRVEGHVLRATTELPDIRVHYDQCSPGRLHLRPVHTECPCSTDKRGFYRQLH